MSAEVTDLLKAWMEGSHRQERRREEEQQHYEQERAEEKRCYEQERAAEKQERVKERQRYKELVRGLMTGRPCRIKVGPESLKLTKLTEMDDIEAFLIMFERAVEVHRVEQDKRATILAPQLTEKARLA